MESFKNKKILVTGGTGSIGSELIRQLLKFKPKRIRVYSRDDSKQFYLEQELREYKCMRYLIGSIDNNEPKGNNKSVEDRSY